MSCPGPKSTLFIVSCRLLPFGQQVFMKSPDINSNSAVTVIPKPVDQNRIHTEFSREFSYFRINWLTMNYSSLFLSNKSIENAFKRRREKTNKNIFASNVKLQKSVISKQPFMITCTIYMYRHNRINHYDIPMQKCTDCSFTHMFPTKVRLHHRQVHLGVPRKDQHAKKKFVNQIGL